MPTPHRLLAAISSLSFAGLLAGCTVSREVDVHNLSQRPIQAEILVRYPDGAVTTSQSARIAPGDRMTLGPILTKPDLEVVFRAAPLPAAGLPAAWRALPVGLTVVEVVGGGGDNPGSAPVDIRGGGPHQ